MDKEQIIAYYQEAIDTAREAVSVAQAALEALAVERDEKIAQCDDYANALEQKRVAEEIIAKGLPNIK